MRYAALPLLLLLSGCAGTALPRPGAERDAEIAEMKRRLVDVQRRATVSELELARLREQVARLEARLAARPTAGEPAPAAPVAPRPTSPPAAAESPAGPPAAVEAGDLEDEELAVAGPVPSTPSTPRVDPPAAATAPTTPAGPLAAVGREAQAIYDDAYTLFHQGRYPEAEERFATFLLGNPDTELSDNAQYWIGASRFARGDYRGALVAFRQTVERYPGENKVPDALFKIGQSLEELADAEGAKAVYRELRERFPETAAATLAGERLDALP